MLFQKMSKELSEQRKLMGIFPKNSNVACKRNVPSTLVSSNNRNTDGL